MVLEEGAIEDVARQHAEYIKMTSSNFGNVFSAGSECFLPFLPMLLLHLLIQNLLYDVSQVAIRWCVDDEQIQKRARNPADLGLLLFFGPSARSSIF